MEFNLLSTGQKQANNGQSLDISPSLLKEIVDSFQESKGKFLPPVLKGHQEGDDRERSDGIDALIGDLRFDGEFLKGKLVQIQDKFWEAVRGKGGDFTPYLSSRILPPDHPYNPNPGKWSLGHVARVALPGDPNLGYLFNQEQKDGVLLALNQPLDFAESTQPVDPGDRMKSDDTTASENMPTEISEEPKAPEETKSNEEGIFSYLKAIQDQQKELLDRIAKLEENDSAPAFDQVQNQIDMQNRAIWEIRLSPHYSKDRLKEELDYLDGLNKAKNNGIEFGQDPVESRIQELVELAQGVKLGEPPTPTAKPAEEDAESPIDKAMKERKQKYEGKA